MNEKELIKKVTKAERLISEELKLVLIKKLFNSCARNKKDPVIMYTPLCSVKENSWWRSKIS